MSVVCTREGIRTLKTTNKKKKHIDKIYTVHPPQFGFRVSDRSPIEKQLLILSSKKAHLWLGLSVVTTLPCVHIFQDSERLWHPHGKEQYNRQQEDTVPIFALENGRPPFALCVKAKRTWKVLEEKGRQFVRQFYQRLNFQSTRKTNWNVPFFDCWQGHGIFLSILQLNLINLGPWVSRTNTVRGGRDEWEDGRT